jgi:phosphoribosylformimino-5-aminoimidazole carboxamide ribotide isomerase
VILYPAIDIRGGRAVRLVQGDYDRETKFDADPVDAARRWAGQGARALHVVDLDGARSGRPESLEIVEEIVDTVGVPVQFGGGLRTAEAVDAALATGVERVVLGTAALTEPALVEALIAEHGGSRVVVAADSRGGRIAVEGWERGSEIETVDLIADLGGRGVGAFLYTPVEVDGTLSGPSLDGLSEVEAAAATAGAGLVYSGGVSSLDDLATLANLGLGALEGVIVGRALYDGRFDVGEGQGVLDRVVEA